MGGCLDTLHFDKGMGRLKGWPRIWLKPANSPLEDVLGERWRALAT